MPSSNAVQETISDCVCQLAQSNCIESQTNALKTLASLTTVSTRNRHLLSQTHDSIPTILDLSRSSVPEIQTLALSILFNLSLNPNLKQTLARPTTISHLNSLILVGPSSSSSEATVKIVSALVCSLAMLDKNKAMFGVSGTVEAIVKALRNNISASSFHNNLLSSLVELMQFHGNCTLAVKLGLVETVVNILSDSISDLWSSCLSILSLLARFEEGIQSISEVEGVLELLVAGLSKGCMVSRESSADIMIKLFERNKELMMMNAVESSEMMCLLADLSIRGSNKAREKAGVLMKMMMDVDFDVFET